MIFLISIVITVLSLNCPSYSCNSVGFPDSSYCIYTNSTTRYLNLCNSLTYSCQADPSALEAKCTYTDNYIPYSLLPGASCIYSEDCFTNNCIDGLCIGTRGECANNSMCDVGYYCNSGYCASQILVNTYGCSTDNDCVNSAGCLLNSTDSSKNKCVYYGSLPVGTKVYNSTTWLCETGFTYNETCMKPPVSSGLPIECDSNNDCASEISNDLTFYSSCECGWNIQGASYCSLFPGDSAVQKFLKIFYSWTSSKQILNCHTENRFENSCVIQNWDKKDSNEFVYYKDYKNLYPFIYDADICAVQIFAPEYYELMNQVSEAAYLIISLIILVYNVFDTNSNKENFTQLFGTKLIGYLLPIKSEYAVDGITYPIIVRTTEGETINFRSNY